MSIIEKRFEKSSEAVLFMEELAHGRDDYVFRGHAKETYKLTTTLRRHTSIPVHKHQKIAFKRGLELLPIYLASNAPDINRDASDTFWRTLNL